MQLLFFGLLWFYGNEVQCSSQKETTWEGLGKGLGCRV